MELSGDALRRPGPPGPSGQSASRMAQMMEEWEITAGPDMGGPGEGPPQTLGFDLRKQSSLIHLFPSRFTLHGGEQGLE